ncbi:MAG: LysR family transcriptional regulator [Pseudomonadota bacterium]
MNWQSINFDWNQARGFLVTAEEGSLSAAARALGLTQPTLGRQVAALEDALGVVLFDRAGRSMTLSPSGLELLDHMRAMADAANRVSLSASGQSQVIAGKVSITATGVMATHHLPKMLGALKQKAPEISVEIIESNEQSDLTRREADIAIRHARPEQPDLIAKLIGETSARLYASADYLDKYGRPEAPKDLSDADFIGFGPPERQVPMINMMGLELSVHNVRVHSVSGTVILELLKQGLGVGFMTEDIEKLVPDIERVLPTLSPIPVPIWLVTHRELHTSRRIRIVFDVLAEQLPRVYPTQPGT